MAANNPAMAQRKRSFWGMAIVIGMLIAFGTLFFRACTNPVPIVQTFSSKAVATVQPTVQVEAQPVAPVSTALPRKMCWKGACIRIPECSEIGQLPGMALNDGCADSEPANQGGYGLGDVTDKIPAVIDLDPPSVEGWWLVRMNFLERKNTCIYSDKSKRLDGCKTLPGEWLTYLGGRHYVSVALANEMESDQ